MAGMFSLSLTRRWYATWLALARQGGLDVVGSFNNFLYSSMLFIMDECEVAQKTFPHIPIQSLQRT